MGKPSEEPPKRRKKKGRPSLLDLQKRNLRLQTQNPNPNPPPTNPNPYLRFPQPAPPRRSTRRNPAPSPPTAAADVDDDEDEDGSSSGKRRREKKLRLVLRLPHDHCSDSDSAAESGKRRIRAKTHSPASKGTDALQAGEPLDSGPMTPLPDKKLLLFILDRLQKKDTYGVFSEPVDPDELPDYFDIIDHPMDFGTVRKKLSDGAYQTLEQFEKDIFLISSNAMTYNASDTIYYRQARAIQELAKKNFENLRQESDGNESEPKVVRRGRPPGKNTSKWAAGKSTDHAASCFSSDATLADAKDNGQMSNLANDLSRKALSADKPGVAVADISTRSSYGLRNSASCRWIKERKSERSDENTGSTLKGVSTKYGKKPAVVDENRRNMYQPPLSGGSMHESPYLFTFDGRKQLLPVGLHMEHAYAKSLARFVANLGPKVWEIAARRIQRALPPGTKFGWGWVGDSEGPQQFQPPIPCYSPLDPPELKPSISTLTSRDNKPPERPEPPYTCPAVEESHSSRITSAYPNQSSDGMEGVEPGTTSRLEGRFILPSGASGFQPNSLFQLHQPPVVQPRMNGLNAAVFGSDSFGQAGKVLRPIRPPENFNLEAPHGGVLDMVSSNIDRFYHETSESHLDDEKLKAVGHPGTTAPNRSLPDTSRDFHGPWQASSRPKPVSDPPDLNVSFQSPSSPAAGLVVESQQPDLALQL